MEKLNFIEGMFSATNLSKVRCGFCCGAGIKQYTLRPFSILSLIWYNLSYGTSLILLRCGNLPHRVGDVLDLAVSARAGPQPIAPLFDWVRPKLGKKVKRSMLSSGRPVSRPDPSMCVCVCKYLN